MQDLGDFGYTYAAAYGVSGMDRSWSASRTRQRPTPGLPLDLGHWHAKLSMMYSSRVGSGSYLQYANAVSGDGIHVVGYGYRSRNRYEAYCTH